MRGVRLGVEGEEEVQAGTADCDAIRGASGSSATASADDEALGVQTPDRAATPTGGGDP